MKGTAVNGLLMLELQGIPSYLKDSVALQALVSQVLTDAVRSVPAFHYLADEDMPIRIPQSLLDCSPITFTHLQVNIDCQALGWAPTAELATTLTEAVLDAMHRWTKQWMHVIPEIGSIFVTLPNRSASALWKTDRKVPALPTALNEFAGSPA